MFLNIGYSNEWWHANHGFSFDEELYRDPLRKLAVQHRMDELLYEKFAKWDFLAHMEDTSVLSRPSVNIEPYGHRFVPAMFGIPVCYAKDQAPWAMTQRLDDDFIMSLKPITRVAFANDPRVREIVRQQQEYPPYRVSDDRKRHEDLHHLLGQRKNLNPSECVMYILSNVVQRVPAANGFDCQHRQKCECKPSAESCCRARRLALNSTGRVTI